MNRLHQENRLTTDEYSAIFDALDEIELLRDRDEQLENLWEQLADIPIDPETECIEEPFLGWGVGISKDDLDAMRLAYECMVNPGFYRQLGRDPAAEVKRGIGVLVRLYGSEGR